MNQKIYVLDTSVLVHDPTALSAFRDTTVVVPIFVVMELDDLKNSRRLEVATAARMASRFVAELREYGSLRDPEGVVHPELGTRFYVVANGGGHGLGALEQTDSVRKMDWLILSTATSFRDAHPSAEVILVSKDVNLRILADFEGIRAQDYNKDRVQLTELYVGYRRLEGVDAELLGRAFIPDETISAEELGVDDLLPNEFVVASDGDNEVVLRRESATTRLRPVGRDFLRETGIEPRNTEQRMALDLLLDDGVPLITLIGKAGTGKTFLALAAAMGKLRFTPGPGHYERILLSKPVIPMGKDIGYLPGDFEAKMQPWMTSFFDNLDQLIPSDALGSTGKGADKHEKSWEHLFASRRLEVQAIHSIRGRSISNAFMLIDEAQNLTPHEVKTIITRAANGTKVVLAGDPFQVDNHFLDQHTNGLVYVTERLKDSEMTGTVFFTKGERSRLAELAATKL